MTKPLSATLAGQRRAKAERCERNAAVHGADSSQGITWTREARYWRAAADLAERGDLTPNPAIPQTEDREDGRTVALVYRAAPMTGLVDCVTADGFSQFTIAHAWGTLAAEELNKGAASA